MWLHFSQKPSTRLPVFLRESNTTIHDHSRHRYTVYELFLKNIDSERKKDYALRACVCLLDTKKIIVNCKKKDRKMLFKSQRFSWVYKVLIDRETGSTENVC